MIRSELIKTLAAKNDTLLVSDVERIVDTFFDTIVTALVSDNRVEIRGFGTFATRGRADRVARNPRTGESVTVKSKRVPHFKYSKNLGEIINSAH